MPDWDEINKRIKEEAENPAEKKEIPGDLRNEGHSAWSNRMDREEEAKEKSRRNEPGMFKIQWTIKFHSLFGYFSKEAREQRKKDKAKSNKQNEN